MSRAVPSVWRAVFAGLSIFVLHGRTLHAQQDSVIGPWDSVQAWTAPVRSTPWDSAESGWKGRLVVGEYTTGIFCGFCQVDDVAFDALQRRYPATAFIPLAYHYYPNLPLGDPADSLLEHMDKWYGGPGSGRGIFDQRKSRKALAIDGEGPEYLRGTVPKGTDDTSGTSHSMGDARFALIKPAVDAELQRPPEAFFQTQTTVSGGEVHVQVRIDSVIGQHPTTYLRVLLVEDTVSLLHPLYWYIQRCRKVGMFYKALRREHHMVVRAVAHDKTLPMGLPVHGPGTISYTFDMAAIQRHRLTYRAAGLSAIRPYVQELALSKDDETMAKQIVSVFPDIEDWRMDPRRLHAVVFVQDAHTGEVLQAAMVRVPPGLQLP